MNPRAAATLRHEALRLRAAALSVRLDPGPPSPLQLVEGLPEPWSRARIWVKRDDLCGPGGTKVRKLAAALSAARASGAKTVVTFGHLDSNHALATALAARDAGLGADLWIQASAGSDLPERRQAFAAVATRVSYRQGQVGLVLGAAGSIVAGWLQGYAPCLLLPGGTTPATCAAVAPLALEVAEQFETLGEPLPERWAAAVGSGGTLAGLCAGLRALQLPCRLVGFHASDPWLVRPSLVAAYANAALDRLGLSGHLSADQLELSIEQLGQGHGIPTEASQRAQVEWAAAGIELDPIFTAKAAAGVRAAIERGPPGQSWLFFHTGTKVGP
jgi:D-cysteine desulfhydrase